MSKLIFVDGKCKPGDDDCTVYNTLDTAEDHQSYSADVPIQTIGIINKYI